MNGSPDYDNDGLFYRGFHAPLGHRAISIAASLLVASCAIILLAVWTYSQKVLVASVILGGLGVVCGEVGVSVLIAWTMSRQLLMQIDKECVVDCNRVVPWRNIVSLSPAYRGGKVVYLWMRTTTFLGYVSIGRAIFLKDDVDANKWRKMAMRIRTHLVKSGCNALIEI